MILDIEFYRTYVEAERVEVGVTKLKDGSSLKLQLANADRIFMPISFRQHYSLAVITPGKRKIVVSRDEVMVAIKENTEEHRCELV